ncbi:MAG: hypothetical protein ACI9J3_000412 [Parvicellaceae bacterium]|jgi:hypothetical protein
MIYKQLLLVFAFVLVLMSFTSESREICTVRGKVINEIRGVSMAKIVLLVDGHESVEATTNYMGEYVLQYVPTPGLKHELKCSAKLYHSTVVNLVSCKDAKVKMDHITLNPLKENLIPGRTIKWDMEAWDRRSSVH